MQAENLRKLRKYLKYTIDELAEILDIPKRTLAGYERKERTPSVEFYGKLNSILKVNLNWIVSGSGEMFLSPADENTFKKKDIKTNINVLDIGKKLLDIKTENDLSSFELAAILGMSEERFSHICVGKEEITLKEAISVLENFDISPNVLFQREKATTNKVTLDLTPEQHAKLIKMLEG